ncbi:hypothetical protein FCM35_KLT07892 [Carex littledalei]|uniref:C2H2-type domain-containing protein n=1 Tax=Carex littledalei TaxID=544730 RepID=A0A833V6G6_9POAL|nr:hypothetical protein FCM35_KLT07892 [Carex littledalei]
MVRWGSLLFLSCHLRRSERGEKRGSERREVVRFRGGGFRWGFRWGHFRAREIGAIVVWHMNSHSGDKTKRKSAYGHEEPEDLTPDSNVRDVSGDLKRKTRSAYGNEEPEDLTPKSKLKFDLNKMPEELLEIDIPESGAEQVEPKSLSLEMWLKDREKIQVTDPASEEKEQIDQATKAGPEADLKTTVYECNTCYRTFGSQQVLGDHLTGQTSDGTCPQDIESTAVVPRFNCDGYILKSNYVGWATRRRSVKVVISDLVRN